jgi:hypothetical protein
MVFLPGLSASLRIQHTETAVDYHQIRMINSGRKFICLNQQLSLFFRDFSSVNRPDLLLLR